MAIRKLRKQMKPLIALFVVAFILTILGTMAAYVVSLKSANEQKLAFKLNGKKVEVVEVERAFINGLNNIRQNYGNELDENAAKIILLNNVVEQKLLLQAASDLKVKVSNKDVEAEVDRIESNFPEKEQFTRWLSMQNLTTATLKNEIKNYLLVAEVRTKIEEQASATDAEVEEYYNDNKFSLYLNQSLEEAKEGIKERLVNTKKSQIYNAYVENLMKSATYEDVKEAYQPFLYAIALEEGEFKFSNVEVSNRSMIQKYYGATDNETAKDNAIEFLKSEVTLAEAALEKGALINKELAVADQLNDLREQLEKILMNETEANEEDVKAYFTENEVKYETKESADIELIEFELVASEADIEQAKVKAEELLAKAKEEKVGLNEFGEMAKEFSQGPSAPYGGDLGWFTKGKMVKEFEEAAFAAEKGSLVESVVKTQFGYHLIYVDDKKEENGEEQVKASHILITETAGEATKEETLKKVDEVKAMLENNEIKFEDAVAENSKLKESTISNINRGGYIPGIGFDKEFSEAIFEAELDNFTVFSGDRIILFKKTNYVPYEAAKLEELKERVEYDYLKEKINKEIMSLVQ